VLMPSLAPPCDGDTYVTAGGPFPGSDAYCNAQMPMAPLPGPQQLGGDASTTMPPLPSLPPWGECTPMEPLVPLPGPRQSGGDASTTIPPLPSLPPWGECTTMEPLPILHDAPRGGEAYCNAQMPMTPLSNLPPPGGDDMPPLPSLPPLPPTVLLDQGGLAHKHADEVPLQAEQWLPAPIDALTSPTPSLDSDECDEHDEESEEQLMEGGRVTVPHSSAVASGLQISANVQVSPVHIRTAGGTVPVRVRSREKYNDQDCILLADGPTTQNKRCKRVGESA
jgi:hypothetical protein